MHQLALIYGGWTIVSKFISSLKVDIGIIIMGQEYFDQKNYKLADLTDDVIVIVPASVNPMNIPEFLMCFNSTNPTNLYTNIMWVVQGKPTSLQALERYNPVVVVTECENFILVKIGDELRFMELKPDQKQDKIPVTLYVRPKSNSARRIIVDNIMPKMDIIKKRFDFTLSPIGDDSGNVPSSIQATPALVHPNGVIYTSEAIIKFLLQYDSDF